MTPRDRDAFRQVLDNLGEVFGREVKPALVDLYWQALRDLALSTVQALATSHSRHGKYFPKPFELRPAESRAAPPATDDRAFRAGQDRSTHNLQVLAREQPEAHRAEVQLRWADRIIATADPSSPEYADAIVVAHRLRHEVRGY